MPELKNEKTSEENVKVIKSEPLAKSGKRSAKVIKETEAIKLKEERKLAKQTIDKKSEKNAVVKTRSKLERRSKAYRNLLNNIDIDKKYSLAEACSLISKISSVKFDATIELHMKLLVDPRQADQNIRDSVLLPSGSGKNVRIAAFVGNDDIDTAKKAGADLVGEESIIKELETGNLSFDVLISTPAQMSKLGKYARTLGPRGLMPNPKSGTVTNDVTKAISEARAGKVEYRVDSGGNLHIPVGKVSFKPNQILDNLNAIVSSVQSNKPNSLKGNYIASSHLTTSMGPSIKIVL